MGDERQRLNDVVLQTATARGRAEEQLAAAKRRHAEALTALAALDCADGHDWFPPSKYFAVTCRRCDTFKDPR